MNKKTKNLLENFSEEFKCEFSNCCDSHLLMMRSETRAFILVCGDCFNPIYVGKTSKLSNIENKNYGIIEDDILDVEDLDLYVN